MMIKYESLESLCDVIDPHPSHRAPKAEPIGIPFLGIGDFDSNGAISLSKARIVSEKVFDEHKQRYSLQDDLLVFGRVASIGKVVELPKTDEKFVISPTLAVLKPKAIDLKYLKYAVQSPYFMRQMDEMSTGSTRKSVGMKNLRKANVPTFPINEQKRIVAILDQAFADIDKARALTEQNLKNARELFDSYLQQLFAQGGEGWTEASLSSLCKIKHGFAFKSKDFTTKAEGDEPIVLTPGNYTEYGGLNFSDRNTKRCITEYREEYLFQRGDLTVVMTDLSSQMKILGKPALIENDNVLHNQRIGKFEFLSEKLHKKFLYYFLLSDFSLKNIRETATGTMVRHTAPGRILDNIISFPVSPDKQREITVILDQLRFESLRLETIYQKKLAVIDDLKKSLLKKAFSGELTKDKQEAA